MEPEPIENSPTNIPEFVVVSINVTGKPFGSSDENMYALIVSWTVSERLSLGEEMVILPKSFSTNNGRPLTFLYPFGISSRDTSMPGTGSPA